jgi:hypothetical protein
VRVVTTSNLTARGEYREVAVIMKKFEFGQEHYLPHASRWFVDWLIL